MINVIIHICQLNIHLTGSYPASCGVMNLSSGKTATEEK